MQASSSSDAVQRRPHKQVVQLKLQCHGCCDRGGGCQNEEQRRDRAGPCGRLCKFVTLVRRAWLTHQRDVRTQHRIVFCCVAVTTTHQDHQLIRSTTAAFRTYRTLLARSLVIRTPYSGETCLFRCLSLCPCLRLWRARPSSCSVIKSSISTHCMSRCPTN